MEKILRVDNLSSGYGQFTVLRDINLYVGEGEIVSVVGANGAGKSTLLWTIAGHLSINAGQIRFENQSIANVPAHDCPAKGLVLIPEGGRLFPFMTVLENLQLGAYHSTARHDMKRKLEEVFELFPLFADRSHQLAGRLSGGERQMCAVARAMMANPKLLMLDEPSLGLAPIMVGKIFELIKQLVKTKKVSILLVEQNVGNALDLSERGYVLEQGQIRKSGASKELLIDADIQRSYMGL